MVNEPFTWVDAADDDERTTAAEWKERVIDQMRALDVFAATTPGDLIISDGERSLTRLPAPTGMTEPVLVGNPVRWVEKSSLTFAGGGDGGRPVITQIYSGTLSSTTAQWEQIRQGTETITLPTGEIWLIVVGLSGTQVPTRAASFTTDALRAVPAGIPGSVSVPDSQRFLVGWGSISIQNWVWFLGRNSDNHIMILRNSGNAEFYRIYRIG